MRPWILVIVFACAARAQDQASEPLHVLPQTRAGEIELQRDNKAASLTPQEPEKGEKILNRIQRSQIYNRTTGQVEGWRITMGGLVPYSGFSLGPEYYRRLLHERAVFQTTIVGSYKEFYKLGATFHMPTLANDHAFFSLDAVTLNYPRIDTTVKDLIRRKRGARITRSKRQSSAERRG